MIRFMVNCIVPPNFRPPCDFFNPPLNFRPIAEILRMLCSDVVPGPGPCLFFKFQSSVERANIDWAWPFYLKICFIILCIIPTKFPADSWNPWRVRAVTSSLKPGQKAYHGKFQSSVERKKIGRAWSFQIAICSVVLCITPTNFRLIAEDQKSLKS